MDETKTTPSMPKVSLHWDTNTGLAVIVLGAVLLLFLLDRGFRGFTV